MSGKKITNKNVTQENHVMLDFRIDQLQDTTNYTLIGNVILFEELLQFSTLGPLEPLESELVYTL